MNADNLKRVEWHSNWNGSERGVKAEVMMVRDGGLVSAGCAGRGHYGQEQGAGEDGGHDGQGHPGTLMNSADGL